MTDSPSFSYLSPKLEARMCVEKGGFGVFAHQSIAAGEVLTVWGGVIVSAEGLAAIPQDRVTHGIQVEENIYLIPMGEQEAADMFNHSCTPNAGLNGQISLVAMRDIAVDEEICFDYAMSDSSDYDEFNCACGAPDCRNKVTGNDWKLADLQRRYDGFFSPYLQRRILRLQKQATGR